MRTLLFSLLVLGACRSDKTGGTDTADAVVDSDADSDGDGYAASEDCNDQDASVSPAAEEICDSIDNNCDGSVDEGVTSTFYADSDLDGFGNEAAMVDACDAPSGYVSIPNDCDDSDGDSFPGASERCDGKDNDCDGDVDEDVLFEWYADADEDGYGDLDSLYAVCDPPPGYVSNADDCDDTNGSAYPGAAEVCDEADNNCDGAIDEDVTTTFYQDADGDGYGVSDKTTEDCDLPTGFAATTGDCDDSDGTVSPNATEICDDIDNNCDGDIDSDAVDRDTWYADADSDGYGDEASAAAACEQPSGYTDDDADCDDTDGAVSPAASEVCNAVDDDCDGTVDEDDATDAGTWYADNDGDGYGGSSTTVACDQPSGFADNNDDCDDGEADANPGEVEVCDRVDNDCDGDTDEGVQTTYYADADGDGYGAAAYDLDACTAPSGYVSDDTDCADDDSSVNPGAPEVCDDTDNDCDGDTDEGLLITVYPDDDGDGYGDEEAAEEACAAGSGTVTDGGDCDDNDDDVYPGAEEYCNAVDDDCDASVDEDAVDTETLYDDADGDGYGDPGTGADGCAGIDDGVDNNDDCDDADAGVSPDAEEVWYDGVDSDCDGESDYDADGDGYIAYLEGGGQDCDDTDASVYSCGDSQAAAVPSCLALLELDSTRGDGLYWLDPDIDGDTSDAEEVYCDMTDDGGGWALVQWGADNDSATLTTDSAVGTLSAPNQSTSAKLDRDFMAELADIGEAEFRYGHTDYGYIYLSGLSASSISPGTGSTGYGVPVVGYVAALRYGGATYAGTRFSWPQNGVPQVCTNTSGTAECDLGLHLGTWGGVYPDGVYMNYSTAISGHDVDIHYELWVK